MRIGDNKTNTKNNSYLYTNNSLRRNNQSKSIKLSNALPQVLIDLYQNKKHSNHVYHISSSRQPAKNASLIYDNYISQKPYQAEDINAIRKNKDSLECHRQQQLKQQLIGRKYREELKESTEGNRTKQGRNRDQMKYRNSNKNSISKNQQQNIGAYNQTVKLQENIRNNLNIGKQCLEEENKSLKKQNIELREEINKLQRELYKKSRCNECHAIIRENKENQNKIREYKQKIKQLYEELIQLKKKQKYSNFSSSNLKQHINTFQKQQFKSSENYDHFEDNKSINSFQKNHQLYGHNKVHTNKYRGSMDCDRCQAYKLGIVQDEDANPNLPPSIVYRIKNLEKLGEKIGERRTESGSSRVHQIHSNRIGNQKKVFNKFA